MGKLADTLRDVTLPPEKKAQVNALDRELENLKIKERQLEAMNAQLQAEAAPAKRALEILKSELDPPDDSVAEITAKILNTIAVSEISQESIIQDMGLDTTNGHRHFDALVGKKYIVHTHAGAGGTFYRATADGRAYLARHGVH